jgi:hypothetical protein
VTVTCFFGLRRRVLNALKEEAFSHQIVGKKKKNKNKEKVKKCGNRVSVSSKRRSLRGPTGS